MSITIASILLDAERQAADRPAIRLDGGSRSFGELAREARALAACLAAHGVGRGDRVALLLRNGEAFVTAHYALAFLGAVIVPLNPQLGGAIPAAILERAAAVCLIGTEALIGALADRERIAARLRTMILLDEEEGSISVRAGIPPGDARPMALTGIPPIEEPSTLSGDDPALLFFTSGTTGVPKGVMLTHAQALFGIDAWSKRWSFGERTVSLMAAPFFHVVYNPMVLGAHRRLGSIALESDFSVRAITAAVERYRVTALMGTPAFMSQLATERWARRNDLSSLDTLIYGAAPTPPPVVRSLADFFPAAARYNCYGLTETSSALTCLGEGEIVGREASVGRPHPGVELRIVDGEGRDLPRGERGEVCARGPHVIAGYHQAPEIDRQRFFGEWLRTGDVGYFDDEGYLFLLDRVDDLINVAGEKYYPCQIEEVLLSDRSVAEAAAVGVTHPTKGQVIHAFVVSSSTLPVDAAALRKRCIDQLPAGAVPRRIAVLDQLPRNPTGKILRRELLSLAEPGSAE